MLLKSDTEYHTENRVQLAPSSHFSKNPLIFPSAFTDKSLHCRLMPYIGKLFIQRIMLSWQHSSGELCWFYTTATICCRGSRNSVISMKYGVNLDHKKIALQVKANNENLFHKVINSWLRRSNREHCCIRERNKTASVFTPFVSKYIRYSQHTL